MTIIDAVILGILQGLTEFLPISSSGHLVFFQHLMGLRDPMIAFDIAVHWGTLSAVAAYFMKDFYRMIVDTFHVVIKSGFRRPSEELLQQYPYALIAGFVLVSTATTVIIVLFFQDILEHFFQSVVSVGIAWLVMGILLLLSVRFQKGDRTLDSMNQFDAFLIGTAQGLAVFPGISRSGLTIFTGMIAGLDRREAARFSFLISVPAIIGAGILKFREGVAFAQTAGIPMLVGFVVAAVVGYIALALLVRLIRSGRFYLFGYYCLVMSAVALGYVLWTSLSA